MNKSDSPRDCITAAYDMLFGVYKDSVHQNTVTHMDGSIEYDGMWKKIWKKLFFLPTQ